MPGSPFKRYPNQTFDIEGFFDTMDRAGNLNVLARLTHFYFAVPIAPLLAVIVFDAHCSQGSEIVNCYGHAIQCSTVSQDSQKLNLLLLNSLTHVSLSSSFFTGVWPENGTNFVRSLALNDHRQADKRTLGRQPMPVSQRRAMRSFTCGGAHIAISFFVYGDGKGRRKFVE